MPVTKLHRGPAHSLLQSAHNSPLNCPGYQLTGDDTGWRRFSELLSPYGVPRRGQNTIFFRLLNTNVKWLLSLAFRTMHGCKSPSNDITVVTCTWLLAFAPWRPLNTRLTFYCWSRMNGRIYQHKPQIGLSHKYMKLYSGYQTKHGYWYKIGHRMN